MKKILLSVLFAVSLPIFAADLDTGEGANQVIEEQANTIMNDLSANSAKYLNDTQSFEKFIDEKIGDRLDFEKMSQIALGRYLRQVKSEGKFQEFENAFHDLLIRVYSKSWENYTDAKFKVIGVPEVDQYNRAQVRLQVTGNDGNKNNVTFALFYSNGLWKVYDATFENISLMTSYRNTFNTELQKGSVDDLIKKMREIN